MSLSKLIIDKSIVITAVFFQSPSWIIETLLIRNACFEVSAIILLHLVFSKIQPSASNQQMKTSQHDAIKAVLNN